jgi:phage shock protein C
MLEPRLVRSESDRIIAGVCGGIAAYLGIDAFLVRLAFIILAFASGIGILSYILLMFIMPSAAQLEQPGDQVLQENLKDLSNTLSDSVDRATAHPRGPQLAAAALIVLGIFLLLQNLGWISGLINVLIWPLIFIGLGIWLVRRRR